MVPSATPATSNAATPSITLTTRTSQSSSASWVSLSKT
ncbi:hydrophobin 2 [Moniliophthora roreri]|nr:hydrophobin 2 [Moniliophthora roreri]